jgi:AraC-like DNA-binding protein/quercetin dioxygenase-like cupin family protein
MKKNEPQPTVVRIREYATEHFCLTLSDYPTGLRQAWHQHDNFVIAVTLRGLVREQVGRNDALIRPYRIGVKPGGVRHTDHFSDTGVRVLRLAISSELEDQLRHAGSLCEDWIWDNDPSLCRPLLRLARQLLLEQRPGINPSEEVFEAIAGIRRKSVRSHYDPPRWLEQAREDLESTFAQGTRLSELSSAARVHPAYFARRFAEFYGCSVGSYVRRLQLNRTTELLSSGESKLADVALAVGFSDQAHLTRTFISEFGLTPGKLRELLK